eukprot:CAMPEP_0170508918 /NCGR_PEP_ID=MMETSP0208-20121228/63815_1 /TAXON_ID=197538 /ORGANISM="Strombidium inclinatum, Strain S3" /LENGTH=91 /DNA_ID=CAMNT_0010792083 /DNA_START=435 /DNA_END=706 /DNA_ORIENTATION=+
MASLFLAIIDGQKKVEVRREVLAEMNDFEPFSQYQQMLNYNREQAGVLTPNGLNRFLSSHSRGTNTDILKSDMEASKFMTSQLNCPNGTQL